MGSKSPFQTDLAEIFRTFVLQWSKHNELSTLVAAAPYQLDCNIKVKATAEPVIPIKRGRKLTQNLTSWPSLGLHAKSNPCLGCVLEGTVDLPFGVTDAMPKPANTRSTSGVYQVRLRDKCLLIYPSNVPMCDGNTPHWNEADKPQPDNSILWIDFVTEGAILHTCHSINGRHQLGECRFVLNTRLLAFIETIIEESQSHPPLLTKTETSLEIINSLLNVLFWDIYRSLLEQKSQGDLNSGKIIADWLSEGTIAGHPEPLSSGTGTVKRCCNFIHGHIGQPLTVEMIANCAFVSPARLNRLFRTELDQSVMEYVNNYRLLQAQKLLVNTNLPINFIGENVGIAEPAYFSRVFRRKTGLTPAQFRRLKR